MSGIETDSIVPPADETTITKASGSLAIKAVDGTKIRMGSDAQGDVLYFNGTDYVRLGVSTANTFLRCNGANQNPTWNNAGDYVYLASADLNGVNTSTLDLSSFTGYRHFIIFVHATTTGTTLINLRFAGDTGNSYSYKKIAQTTEAITTTTGASALPIGTDVAFGQLTINRAPLLTNYHHVQFGSIGLGGADCYFEGRWLNSANVTGVTIYTGGGTPNFSAGSYISVYGVAI